METDWYEHMNLILSKPHIVLEKNKYKEKGENIIVDFFRNTQVQRSRWGCKKIQQNYQNLGCLAKRKAHIAKEGFYGYIIPISWI